MPPNGPLDSEIIRRIQDKGITVRLFSKGRKTISFVTAIRTRNLKEVRKQLEAGADPNHNDEGDSTHPLFYAVHEGAEMVRLLLAAGAWVDGGTAEKTTPLHLAASCGYADVVHALLAAGAEVNALDEYEHTALFAAVGPQTLMEEIHLINPSNSLRGSVERERGGKETIIQLLLSHGADVSTADREVANEMGAMPEAERQLLHMSLADKGGDRAYWNAVREATEEYPTLHDAFRVLRRKSETSEAEKMFLANFEMYETRIRNGRR